MKTFTIRGSPFDSTRALAIGLGAAATLLAGCKVGPDYKEPEVASAQDWANPLEGGLNADPVDLRQWWTTLGDPTLDGLVGRAVQGNLDLRIAQARVREARALRRVVAADALPQVDVNGSYSRSRASENLDFGVGPGGGFNTEETDLYSVGFDASWEIDIFGRVARGVEATEADILAAEESRRNVMVSLLSEVARNYVEMRSFQQRFLIAQANVQSQSETVSLSRARYEAGLSSELDVKRAESQLAATRSTIPTFQAGIKGATHRLGVLLGDQPGALLGELGEPRAIPGVPAEVAIGAPAELLRRRPDIRSAERTVAAANARIGVATADLYPRFRLLGSIGLQAADIGNLVDANSRFFSIGPQMQWNIFDAGRIRGNIAVQDAHTEQAAARYQQTVLLAFEEAENAIVNYAREQERQLSLQEAVAAAQRAVELSNELYARGLTDFFSVLDTQRTLFIQQDALVQSQRNVTANLIAVYKALGGGWEEELPRYEDPDMPTQERSEPTN